MFFKQFFYILYLKSYHEKNYKKFKIAIVTSFILLLTSNRAASLPGLTSNCVTLLAEIEATFKGHRYVV